MIQIFNTLSREKEAFKPLKQEIVKIYPCGPTLYNFAHIGNLRAYLFEDLVSFARLSMLDIKHKQ